MSVSELPNGPAVPDSLYEAIDPRVAQAEEEKRQAEIRAERRRILLRRVLADPEGRAWLWDLLDGCHAFELRFAATGGGPDPMGTWMHAGEQRIGWWLWTQLDDASPELAGEMRRLRGMMPD